MKLWPFVFTLLLAFQPPLCHGQPVTAAGDEALASGLWELALTRYRERLSQPNLAPEDRTQLQLRMAEALIRSGKPSDALPLLAEPTVEKEPEAAFWKAQALAGLSRTEEAVALIQSFLSISQVPLRVEALLTLANLQLALKQEESAMATLEGLANDDDPVVAVDASLRKVEILLDLRRFEEARAAMPVADELAEKNLPLADFLNAQLLLAEDKPADAAAAFSSILENPRGQSLLHYHSAALGLADALHASGDDEAASESLLTFLQNQPDTPVLEAVFSRLLQWLPEKPAPMDPTLERISQWISPAPQLALGLISTQAGGAITAWPVWKETPLLSAFSIFTRAVALHRIGTPESRAESRVLMERLRMEPLPEFLTTRVLMQTGRWLLDEGKIEEAFLILDSLRNSPQNTLPAGEAAFVEARAAFAAGDRSKAAHLFEEAAKTLDPPSARAARLNAELVRLRDPQQSTRSIPKDPQLEIEVRLERALTETDPITSRKMLEAFLLDHPDHTRAAEARLFAVEAALASTPPDTSFASSQLEALEKQPEGMAQLSPERIALAHLRLADLSQDTTETITLARSILAKFPAQPVAEEAAFTLGRNLFEAGDHNEARLVLEKLAASEGDPDRSQAAWLLAARSAALGGTPKSREQALALFDKAIAENGPVTSLAILEKARLMIDVIELNKLPEAVKFLRGWYTSLKEDDPLRLPAGLLLAEAIYAQGSMDPRSLEEALAIYNQLLSQAEDQPALLHRLQYLRGMTLERLPQKDNPSQMRDAEALAAYYSVLEGASATHPPAEWVYFERCGFRAFEMLKKSAEAEKSEDRWKAAIEVAEKIASFKGPKAAEAEAAAQAIRLKYMIWDD